MTRSTAETPRSPPIRCRGFLLLAVLALVAGCGGGDADDVTRAEGTEPIAAIPRPEPGDLPERFAQRLEDAWGRAQQLAVAGYPDRSEAAMAVGELGNLYFAYDLYPSAEASYEVAAALEPDNVAWPYFIGLVRQVRVNPEGALEAFRRAVELGPADLPALYRLGDALLETGDVAGAALAFGAALEAGADVAVLHYGLGRVAALEGRTEEAIAELERALTQQPEASIVHYQLGRQYQKLGDDEAARRHLAASGQTRVVFVDPRARQVTLAKLTTAFEAVRNLVRSPGELTESDILGFAIVRFGDVDGALAAFRRLVTDPEQPLEPLEQSRAYYVLGALEARRNDHQAAIESLLQALGADPEFAAARVLLASRLSRVGRTEEALDHLDRVLAAEPGRPDALLRRAAIHIDSGRDDAALADLERLVESRPGNAEAWLRIAGLEAAAGRSERALDAYRRAQDLPLETSDRVLAHLRMAELQLRRGELEPAAREYERALQVEPGALDAGLGLAAVYVKLGRLEEAIDLYRNLQRGAPGHPGLRAGEAAVLLLAGREAEARRSLETSLEALPGDRTLRQMLARLLAASSDPAVRDGRRAVGLADDLMQRFPTADNLETLAMALAADGQFAAAVRIQKRLLESLEEGGADTERPRRNLALYERDRPCCAADS